MFQMMQCTTVVVKNCLQKNENQKNWPELVKHAELDSYDRIKTIRFLGEVSNCSVFESIHDLKHFDIQTMISIAVKFFSKRLSYFCKSVL